MRALLIGGGGREHAIGLSIVKSGTELFVISPNENPGLMRISKQLIIGNQDDKKFALENAVNTEPDYVFIGPESPLESGVSDLLLKNQFRVFAPTSAAAKLETSKAFCRKFMEDNRLEGNVESTVVSDPQKVEKVIDGIDYDFVIKPDGLTGGKGVVVQGVHFNTKEEGIRIASDYLASGQQSLLVEKKMVGEEFSLQAFVSGSSIHFLPIVQDYKRAYDDDRGPNTGGMGSVCFSEKGLPFIRRKTVTEAKRILKELIVKFSRDVANYVGPIYGGFISTRDGPKLLEINARLGDPEAINVLSLMQNSIMDVAMNLLNGREPSIEFRDSMNVLRYLVPRGYGSKPVPSVIDLDEEGLLLRGLKIYYGSINIEGKHFKQTTSRSLALYSEGDDLAAINARFNDLSSCLRGDFYIRSDIGSEKMIKKKKESMKIITNSRA